ncbi:hypothetical protein [Enterococcus rivorum]|uniref:Uncharacterized protein n=1 Tax=Enterococcus rivorum TaxID=762845 RepID=A0A1E5KXH4_9ENTE|nr:hypothetical protein [Enterococcus rivorum]MBP2099893.1 hypothetical protein [Enterococcus rivorum]OEH82571.1 hypothetical protein BCR26_13045 [Enterococcus rivorum]
MSIVEMLFIGGIVITILSLLGASYNGIQFVRYNRQYKFLPKRKSKNKKKNRKIARKRRYLMKRKKRSFRFTIIFLLFSLILGGSSAYLSYYQSMNLTTDDSDAVVKGYYLLRDFEKQVQMGASKQDEEEKVQQNIRYLATSLASYGTKSASALNTQEGQLALNRYYNALKELGMNASTQTNNFFGNEKLKEEFLVDIEKAQAYEQKAFDYYKVNANAFSEEK